MFGEFQLAGRQLLRRPGFALLVIGIIALGIGATTAIFSVISAVILRPLPFPEPDRLVRLDEAIGETGDGSGVTNLSIRSWQEWRRDQTVLTDLAAATGGALTLSGRDQAENLRAARVSANFFPVLGISPALGRNFRPEEDVPGRDTVAIVSDAFWRRKLGGRSDAIGQVLTLDGRACTVIGVMPPAFRHPYRAEVWVPLAAVNRPDTATLRYLYGVGRLRPGVTLAQADAAFRNLCAHELAADPEPSRPRRADLRPLRASFSATLRPQLFAIGGAAFLLLAIAAANVAGLFLAQAVERSGEVAVRTALGASRWRLIRQSAAQSLLLSGLGGAGGILLAAWTKEFGIRFALGATAADVAGLVMGEGMRLIGAGLLVGGAGAWLLARFLRSQLSEVAPTDPAALAGVAAALAVVTLLACWLPVRRAARVDPLIALRQD